MEQQTRTKTAHKAEESLQEQPGGRTEGQEATLAATDAFLAEVDEVLEEEPVPVPAPDPITFANPNLAGLYAWVIANGLLDEAEFEQRGSLIIGVHLPSWCIC